MKNEPVDRPVVRSTSDNDPSVHLDARREPALVTTDIRTSKKYWQMAALVIVFAAVSFISVVPQSANDFWLQLKIGEMIIHDHSIPETVLFPFTSIQTARFNAHEWLASVGFAALVSIVGEAAIPLAMGASGLALFGIMAWLAYRRSDQNLPVALLLGLIAVVVENYRHTPRPELLSLVLFGIYWHLLESSRYKPSIKVWMAALLTVILWTNIHGSFVVAPIVAFIYAVGVWVDSKRSHDIERFSSATRPREYFLFGVVALGCTLVNPFGWELLQFVFGFAGSSSVSDLVIEWLPTIDPRFIELRGWWIGLGCTLATAVLMLVNWRKVSVVDALTYLFFVILAFKAIRFLVYMGMVAAYVLATLVPQTWKSGQWQKRLFIASTGSSSIVLALAIGFGNASGGYPHRAVVDRSFTQAMRQVLSDPAIEGNVLCSFELGAELVCLRQASEREAMPEVQRRKTLL